MNLFVQPDGTILCRYSEEIDLTQLGKAEIKRTMNVEFNNSRQAWEAKDIGNFPLYCSPSRQTCLEWEAEYVDRLIEHIGWKQWEEK